MVSESTFQLTFKKLPFCGLEETEEKKNKLVCLALMYQRRISNYMKKLLKYSSLFQFIYVYEAGFSYTSTKTTFYSGLNAEADENPAAFV